MIYGFTRSNSKGNVGFLRELRRLNVAMNRTRKQLVLIGDKSTLCRATDNDFRTVFNELLVHVAQHGEILDYEECRDRLSKVSR